MRRYPAAVPQTQLIIFDCDGVLVDSERLSHTVLQQMLGELGVQLSFETTVQRFIGTSLAVCLQRAADLLGRPLPADFRAQFAARTQAAFEAGLTAVPGVRELLLSLTTPYAVASNGNRSKVDFTLGHTALLPFFQGRIFTADDVQHPKPAPDLYLHAAHRLGAAPQHCVVVEDTPTGIIAAKAAGMRAVGYAAMTPAAQLWAAGADAVATSMADVQRGL